MTAEYHSITANGLRFHYRSAGSGAPLVLLHGSLDCTNAMWNNQVPEWAKHYRVLVPDLRGHGRTVNPGVPLSLPLLADDIRAFCDALKLEKPILCGVSMGGMAALEAGMRHPDAFGALIAVAAQVHRPFSPWFCKQLKTIGIVGPGQVKPEMLEAATPLRAERLKAMHPTGPDQWKELLLNLSGLFAAPLLHDPEDYRKIRAPTLVLTGDRDTYFLLEDVVDMYRHIPGAELAVLPGHDHTSYLQAASFAATVIDFLASARKA
jgi:pimeloyl-ACP methyl ester carboxylesterase